MGVMGKSSWMAIGFVLAVCLVAVPTGAGAENDLATMSVGADSIVWTPNDPGTGFVLTIAGPGVIYMTIPVPPGTEPQLNADGSDGSVLSDGQYTYELKAVPAARPARSGATTASETAPAPVQTGSFSIADGSFVSPNSQELSLGLLDILHYDDVIITGSLCVGFDCVNGESFGFATIKLKENNLRILFEDTSTGTFPTNDWQIVANSNLSGGASYFAVEDVTGNRTPFTIEAGAPANSLYVEDYGRVGLGTNIPYVELHIVDGDSPTVRLDQDGSSGWAAQKWDMCGNETNFFIRDVTNGSKLSFRIQPNTPSNTLTLKSNGRVGIGTWSPDYPLEVETTGVNAIVAAHRTDGAENIVRAGQSFGDFGTKSDHALRLIANGNVQATFNTDNSLDMASNATCTAGGVWTNASSREAKEGIEELQIDEAEAALMALNPVKFFYKVEHDEQYLGFIAEDVPDLVAQKDRKGLSSMDIVSVLTKVVQQQQAAIKQLTQKLAELEGKVRGDFPVAGIAAGGKAVR